MKNSISEAAMHAVSTLLKKQVNDCETPSVNYLFFDQKQIIHQVSYGLSDIANNRQTDIRTNHYAFSITKTFTALAILQLAEQKLLDINKPASNYLPDFPYPPEITIKQLLTHTSGIPNPSPMRWIHKHSQYHTFDRNAFFETIYKKNVIPKFLPNEQYTYSNLGYLLLGEIIEKVSGLKYEEYITTNILEKLSVDSSEIGFELSYGTSYAKGYQKKYSLMALFIKWILRKQKILGKSEQKWVPFNEFYVNGAPYGGLISSPNALVIYAQELLKPKSALILKPYRDLLFTTNKLNSGKTTPIAHSWFKGIMNKQEYYTHAGAGGGYYSEMRIYRQLGLGSVIMYNSTGMGDKRLLNKVDCHFITKKLVI